MLRRIGSSIKGALNTLLDDGLTPRLQPAVVNSLQPGHTTLEEFLRRLGGQQSTEKHSLPLIIRLLAVPKKKVSPFKRRMRWRNRWLSPRFDIAVCNYCGMGLMAHQVLPCCVSYRTWRGEGKEGAPPGYETISFRQKMRMKDEEKRKKVASLIAESEENQKEFEELLKRSEK